MRKINLQKLLIYSTKTIGFESNEDFSAIFLPFRTRFWCLILLFFSCFQAVSQDISTLQYKTYEELEQSVDTIQRTSKEVLKYATAYLTKAKSENDQLKVASGYHLFVDYYSHTSKAIIYTDSIINHIGNYTDKNYPAKGYLTKGIQLYYNSNYNEALNNFVIANTHAVQQKNISQQISIKHYIGLLKNIGGESSEALKIFSENIDFIVKNGYDKKDRKQYLKSLFALADSYNRNYILEDAERIHRKGIIESYQEPTQYLYPWFLTSYGVTSYLRESYTKSLDSLSKATTLLQQNEKGLCSVYLYMYRAHKKLAQPNEGMRYLEKIDSIYQKAPKVIFQAYEAYEYLNTEYKATENVALQLATIDKLLATDKIISEDYQNLSKQIVKKYETPILISEKEQLIEKLEAQKFLSKKTILVLCIVLAIFLALSIYFFRRNMLYKKRFESLMKEYDKKKTKGAKKQKDITIADNASIGLPKEKVDKILNKLEKFENTHKFTKRSYTLTRLAKELDTNSTYLSKIINVTKHMNFANYMNELRIDYAIHQLKENKQFRSYTIKAIAIDVGFNNAQSFSIAFHKKTGIHPSYFLKQLENKDSKLTA